MKKSFPGFYHPSDAEIESAWKSDKTLFVFDTNTLLNLYGYAALTRDDFFAILGKISEIIWLPYHVVLEYQRRRLSVVRDEKAIFARVDSCLEKIDSVFSADFAELALHRRFPVLHKNTEKLHSEIKKLIASYKRSVTHWDKKQPCVRGHDSIREKLNNIFENKIGSLPENQTWLDEIYKEGEERYSNKTPPGFKDDKKSNQEEKTFVYAGLKYERRFGDLIIWKQLIEKAKDENIESVVFVTDDAKDDWWYILNSRGEKKIGPRAELREEICKESSIDLFVMYNTADFLDHGKKLLEVDVSDESISDAGNTFINKITRRDKEWYDYLNAIMEQNKILHKDIDSISNLRSENIRNYLKHANTDNFRRNIERLNNKNLIDALNNKRLLEKSMINTTLLRNLAEMSKWYRENNQLSDLGLSDDSTADPDDDDKDK